MKKNRSNILLLFLISYGVSIVLLLYRDLHIELIKLVLLPLLISVPVTFLYLLMEKPINKGLKYFASSKYRKMKEKRSRERIVSKR